jgi:hypothetical protein
MKRYQLFSSCRFVSGFLRGLVYDLSQNQYTPVPNDLPRRLREGRLSPSLLERLLEERLVHPCGEGPAFLPLDPEPFDYPALITNAIVEIGPNTSCPAVLGLLEQLQCSHVQLVVTPHAAFTQEQFEKWMEAIYRAPVKHCEWVLPYSLYQLCADSFCCARYPELTVLVLYDSGRQGVVEKAGRPVEIFLASIYQYQQGQNCKSIHFFSVNHLLFTESLRYNTYYHRKLFIDAFGQIRNGPLTSRVWGHLSELAGSPPKWYHAKPFHRLGMVRKDQVSVCKVCEYRHMCVDSRVPRKHRRGPDWYMESECNYNPYVARWQGEAGYLGLKACGVHVTPDSVTIDQTRLETVLRELYSVELSEP